MPARVSRLPQSRTYGGAVVKKCKSVVKHGVEVGQRAGKRPLQRERVRA